jgi:hypothetical protein
MSAKDPNLKYRIGAETSDFEKGAARVKQGLKDLDKTNSSVLSSIGDAFGVNTGKIEQMTSSIRGLGQQMSQSANTGVSAFGKLLRSITPLGGAIAGIGLGAAIASFKTLAAEADNFRKTVAGANLEMATSAYVDTYRQFMSDLNGDTAKAMAETQSGWKKFWGTIGATAKEYFRSGAFGEAGGPAGAATQTFLENTQAASQAAGKAAQLSNEIYELERKRSENSVKVAQLSYEIAEQTRIAKEQGTSAAEKEAARAKALDLIKQKYDILIPIENAIADKMAEQNALASSTPEQIDRANAQRVKALDLAKQQEQEVRAINRLTGSITNNIKAGNDEQKAALEAQQRMAESRAFWATTLSGLPTSISGGGVTVPTKLGLPPRTEFDNYKQLVYAYFKDAGLIVDIGFRADTSRIYDITNEVQSMMENFVDTTGNALGSLVGDLLSGGDAWGTFGNAALSAMGDMAQAVGKIAIKTGIAALGIEASLKSPGAGWTAIAAGTALVALGAAVKAGLSNVAGGNYGASTNVASSSYSSGNSDYAGREITVKVGGTLEADGNKLIAVINNTNKRNYYTTGG